METDVSWTLWKFPIFNRYILWLMTMILLRQPTDKLTQRPAGSCTTSCLAGPPVWLRQVARRNIPRSTKKSNQAPVQLAVMTGQTLGLSQVTTQDPLTNSFHAVPGMDLQQLAGFSWWPPNDKSYHYQTIHHHWPISAEWVTQKSSNIEIGPWAELISCKKPY